MFLGQIITFLDIFYTNKSHFWWKCGLPQYKNQMQKEVFEKGRPHSEVGL